jgi:hypothetical protein
VIPKIGEQLDQAQRTLRARAPVSDLSSASRVELVPRIALTQLEASTSLGCSEEFLSGAVASASSDRAIGRQAVVMNRASRTASGSSPAVQLIRHAARIGVLGRSAQSISRELLLAFSFRSAQGCRHA